jgi:hypothetical protein
MIWARKTWVYTSKWGAYPEGGGRIWARGTHGWREDAHVSITNKNKKWKQIKIIKCFFDL